MPYGAVMPVLRQMLEPALVSEADERPPMGERLTLTELRLLFTSETVHWRMVVTIPSPRIEDGVNEQLEMEGGKLGRETINAYEPESMEEAASVAVTSMLYVAGVVPEAAAMVE